MKDHKAEKREKTGDVARSERPGRQEPPASQNLSIPFCFGEFVPDEVGAFCPLWEATWSQDARGKAAKK
jgi:hypothetical protein